MGRFVVVYDACVLYPAPLRDFLLQLAQSGLFQARWTSEIQDEWVRSLLLDRPELANRIQRTLELMNSAVEDCLITDYAHLIDSIELPDPDDRHVVAAAIRGKADMIVTMNLKDFPVERLQKFGVEAQHPDDFIVHQFHLSQAQVLKAAKECRERLRNPPVSAEEYLATLESQRLPVTVELLREFVDII